MSGSLVIWKKKMEFEMMDTNHSNNGPPPLLPTGSENNPVEIADDNSQSTENSSNNPPPAQTANASSDAANLDTNTLAAVLQYLQKHNLKVFFKINLKIKTTNN